MKKFSLLPRLNRSFPFDFLTLDSILYFSSTNIEKKETMHLENLKKLQPISKMHLKTDKKQVDNKKYKTNQKKKKIATNIKYLCNSFEDSGDTLSYLFTFRICK